MYDNIKSSLEYKLMIFKILLIAFRKQSSLFDFIIIFTSSEKARR